MNSQAVRQDCAYRMLDKANKPVRYFVDSIQALAVGRCLRIAINSSQACS